MPKTNVFAVAVEKYQSPKISPVRYAENDAKAFMAAWEAIGVDKADCVMLLSADATLASFRSRLKRFLKSVAKGDRVVLFYAGHGAAFNDTSYITVHDTQPGDIAATSIPLSDVLKELRECKSEQALLFIDSCHSGLPITEGMRSIYTNFSAEELTAFCKDSRFHVAFAACEADEYSMSSAALNHGIWSYCVIHALSGKAKDALEKEQLVTGQSLQGYLAGEVPRLLRRERSGSETQTPCVFGNFSKEFVIADLGDLLAARAKAAQGNGHGNFVKRAALRGETYGEVRRLQGFKKGSHRAPDGHYNAAQNFVRQVGSPDVAEHAKSIHESLREEFGYKNKDVEYLDDTGSASIITPEFDVNVWIQQDDETPSDYVLVTEVENFRSPDVFDSKAFHDVFSPHCDTAVLALARDVSVEDLINKIEEHPSLRRSLDYSPDNSRLTLTPPGSNVTVTVTRRQITVEGKKSGDLRPLLGTAQNIYSAITSANMRLLLVAKP